MPIHDHFSLVLLRRFDRTAQLYATKSHGCVIAIGFVRRPVSGARAGRVPHGRVITCTALVVSADFEVHGVARVASRVIFLVNLAIRVDIIRQVDLVLDCLRRVDRAECEVHDVSVHVDVVVEQLTERDRFRVMVVSKYSRFR